MDLKKASLQGIGLVFLFGFGWFGCQSCKAKIASNFAAAEQKQEQKKKELLKKANLDKTMKATESRSLSFTKKNGVFSIHEYRTHGGMVLCTTTCVYSRSDSCSTSCVGNTKGDQFGMSLVEE